jgi:hypothetical protein
MRPNFFRIAEFERAFLDSQPPTVHRELDAWRLLADRRLSLLGPCAASCPVKVRIAASNLKRKAQPFVSIGRRKPTRRFSGREGLRLVR